jgi:hypothetical protein
MIKVKMLVSRTDATTGSVIEVSADEAKRMVDAGQCEIVRAAKVGRAVKSRKPEKAVK